MSVGKLTKSTVHVAAEFLPLEYHVLVQSMCRCMYNTCTVDRVSHLHVRTDGCAHLFMYCTTTNLDH